MNNITEPIKKLAIISRDYREIFANNKRDFSQNLENILLVADNNKCDSILFSLYGIDKRKNFNVIKILNNILLHKINYVFLEEFFDNQTRDTGDYIIYYRKQNSWKEYKFTQKFATLEYTNKFKNEVIIPFKSEIENNRIFPNFTILLCGETNIVKYSKISKQIEDTYQFFNTINKNIKIILNPIHDRMTRFEMKLKRKFLSKNGRVVISVWNKGKIDKNGKVKDGNNPPWTIYYNDKEIIVNPICCNITKNSSIDIGIVDISKLL